MSVESLRNLAAEICYAAPSTAEDRPLLVLNLNRLPSAEKVDYDSLQQVILDIVDEHTFDSSYALVDPMYRKDGCLPYELVVFCAGGRHRPSWAWIIGEFASLDRKYKKALTQLYLVHEKSFVRVAMQLVEQAASPKLARKVKHLRTLAELEEALGRDRMAGLRIDEVVQMHDMQVVADLQHSQRRKNKTRRGTPSCTTPSSVEIAREGPPPVAPRRPASTRPLRAETTQAQARSPEKLLPQVPARRQQQQIESDSETLAEAPRSCSSSSSSSLIIHEDQGLILPEEAPAAPAPCKTRTSASTRPAAALSKARPSEPLRRAISGPLTPSHHAVHNYLPKESEQLAMPTLKQQLRPAAKTAKPVVSPQKLGKLQSRATSEGRVGNLRALFEERARVAEQLRSA
jgi:hypothetical protein